MKPLFVEPSPERLHCNCRQLNCTLDRTDQCDRIDRKLCSNNRASIGSGQCANVRFGLRWGPQKSVVRFACRTKTISNGLFVRQANLPARCLVSKQVLDQECAWTSAVRGGPQSLGDLVEKFWFHHFRTRWPIAELDHVFLWELKWTAFSWIKPYKDIQKFNWNW